MESVMLQILNKLIKLSELLCTVGNSDKSWDIHTLKVKISYVVGDKKFYDVIPVI